MVDREIPVKVNLNCSILALFGILAILAIALMGLQSLYGKGKIIPRTL
jgi:hypothetical protein